MTWWELDDGTFVNGRALKALGVYQTTVPDWAIQVRSDEWPAGNSNGFLKGRYATSAEALDAARKLCQGIDPSTITGGV